MAEEQIIIYHTIIGELLAKGFTNQEILTTLQLEQALDLEEAQTLLRGVYDSWSSVRVDLKLQTEDDRNWHQHLRMQLLQRALATTDTPSLNLALRILDSLAGIQGVTTTIEQMLPLPIILVDAEKE